jgi:hypothetical protein
MRDAAPQLATLLHAGVPLLQALHLLERGENKVALKSILRDLVGQIEWGVTLSQALQQHTSFDTLYCNLVAVGELAGMLDTMLERLASHLEKSEALRISIRTALIYPTAVLGIAISVTVLILIFVQMSEQFVLFFCRQLRDARQLQEFLLGKFVVAIGVSLLPKLQCAHLFPTRLLRAGFGGTGVFLGIGSHGEQEKHAGE